MKICGIYTITNLINNKIYVGYSDNILQRFKQHLSCLKNSKHDNELLQNSWNKYGEINFIFEILEECNSNYLTSQENYWCNILNTHNRDYGFNIQPTRPDGRMSLSIECRKKISILNKGRKMPESTRQIIIQYHKDHPLTEEHKAKLAEARKKVGISKEGRRRITEGRRTTVKPMTDITKEKIRLANLGKKVIGRKASLKFSRKGRSIEQYDLVGNFVNEFIRITDVEKLGFNSDMVIKVCKNVKDKYKNYIWRYKDGNIMDNQ